MDDAQSRRKRNLTCEWAHEWPHQWVHEWPHESAHASTHEGWFPCFQPFKDSPRNIPRRSPRKGPRVDGRGSPGLFSPVLFSDHQREVKGQQVRGKLVFVFLSPCQACSEFFRQIFPFGTMLSIFPKAWRFWKRSRSVILFPRPKNSAIVSAILWLFFRETCSKRYDCALQFWKGSNVFCDCDI